jgi:hypothetical protein
MQIPSQSPILAGTFAKSLLEIEFIGQNQTHKSVSQYDLPINFSPAGGSFLVNPSRGIQLTRYFNMSGLNWQDTDLPLSYQFSYTENVVDGFRDLNQKSQRPTLLTLLSSSALTGSTQILTRLLIFDSYDATNIAYSNVTLEIVKESTNQSVSKILNLIDSVEGYADP